jgi:DNA-binding transcriptional MerR regulator
MPKVTLVLRSRKFTRLWIPLQIVFWAWEQIWRATRPESAKSPPATGISTDTIRFYERQGLVRRSPRTEGAFRLFGLSDIETLKFVRKAQELGFSLNEIRELLILRSDDVPACSHVKDLLDQKLTAVERKITQLQSLERSLKCALQKCKRELKTAAAGHEECCPVIDQINRAARSNSQNEN